MIGSPRWMLAGLLSLGLLAPAMAQTPTGPLELQNVPSCPDTGGAHLNYSGTTGVVSCGSSVAPPGASGLGGVQAVAPSPHLFVTGISSAGVPSLAQPSAADVSGLVASATTDTTNAGNITSGTLGLARLPTIPASQTSGLLPLTGGTLSGSLSAPMFNAGTGGLQIGGVAYFNSLANTSNPILSPETANIPGAGGGASYQGFPTVVGYALTDAGPGIMTYVNQVTDNLTITGTVTQHWGEFERTINILPGSGVMNAELNEYKSYVLVGAGNTIDQGENKEDMVENQGTLVNWTNSLMLPVNDSNGKITNIAYGARTYPTNNNTAAGSFREFNGWDCEPQSGTGSAVTYQYCVFNDAPAMDIVNEGHWSTRNNNQPTVSSTCTLSTGASGAVASSDAAGEFTLAAGQTDCTLTFARAYVSQTPTILVAQAVAARSLSAFTFTGTAGATYDYWVMGGH